MRGAQILHQEEHKALLRETHNLFNKFLGHAGHFPPANDTEEEKEQQHEEDGFSESDYANVNQVLGGDDDYNDQTNFKQELLERTMYWESQEALLQEILEQHSSTGSRLREEIKRHIETAKETNFCDCTGPKLDGCTNCLRGRIVNLLCAKGFLASLCTSAWKRTEKIPGGRHEYIEVIARSLGKKKKVTFLIEIEFRDEFKMAKACDEHKKLIELLPETYVGKPEHLNAIVRVMCDAAKRSTAEKKIHMGPWRKKSFMQMKWSASHENQRRFAYEPSSQVGLLPPEQNDISSVLTLTASTAVRVA